ncbi:MAG: hypothetical protein J5372_06145 [Lachnospiraceae bacterium]|nr:hypothetical protein [Lachnospiraceae bacterium]
MSAIWGVIPKNNKIHLTDRIHEIFLNAYSNSCKVDSYAHFLSKDIYVGCGIQHITESPSPLSPIRDTDKHLIFAADCLLDNRDEIYSLLNTSDSVNDLKKISDDELMYRAYLTLGEEAFSHFTGLYSIAIFDKTTSRLSLISDPVSARCLYYTQTPDVIVFSTLLNPIRLFLESETDYKTEYNEDYFKDFLLSDPSLIYIVPQETPYKNIYMMPPGTIKYFSGDTTCAKEYNNIDVNSKMPEDPELCSDMFMELYRTCISDAVNTTGEVGIALSSGLDSSGIAILASQNLAGYGKNLYSFTFTPHPALKTTTVHDTNVLFDESQPVLDLCNMYPNIKPEFLSNQGKNCFEDVSECLIILEMPYKSGAIPNHLEICKEAGKKNCRIILNGIFGNSTVSFGELHHILYDLYMAKDLEHLISYLDKYCQHQTIEPEKALRKCLSMFSNYAPASFDPSSFVPQNPFLLPYILENYQLEKRFTVDKRTLSRQFIDHVFYPEYLQSKALLMYLGAFETKMGLAHNMILRDPTKDIRIIDFCKRLPYSYFAFNGETRWLTRHGFRNLLPPSILENRQQHAYLNTDYVNRIQRDWGALCPLLSETFKDVPKNLAKSINLKLIPDYLKNMDFNDKRQRSFLKYVIAIYNCILYQTCKR